MSQTSLQPLDSQAPSVVASLLRYWRTSLLIVVGAALAVYAMSLLLPERYRASAGIELRDPDEDSVFITGGKIPEDLERQTALQVNVITSGAVLSRAADIVGASDADDIRGDVSASTDTPGLISVVTGGDSAAGAADLANAVTSAYRTVTRATSKQNTTEALESIETQLGVLDEDIETLAAQAVRDPANRLIQARLQSAIDDHGTLSLRAGQIEVNDRAIGDGVEFVDSATPPDAPVSPVPLRNAGVAALLALLAAGALAWFRADRDRTADDRSTPAAVLDAPLLGAIPVLDPGSDMAALQDGSSLGAESYQVVTASLQHVFRWGVLLVTSASRGDGKTVSAASIAATAARDGTRVVLVDADIRAATLSTRLLGAGQQRPVGLSDVAEGAADLGDAIERLRISDDVTLPFLPAGGTASDVGRLYRVAGMASVLQRLRETYDLVVVDCAALLAVADAASLAVHADGILAVVSRRTPIAVLEAVRQRLDLVDAPLVGYLFTRDEVAAGPYVSAQVSPVDRPAPSRRTTLRRMVRTAGSAPPVPPPSPSADPTGTVAGNGRVTPSAVPSAVAGSRRGDGDLPAPPPGPTRRDG